VKIYSSFRPGDIVRAEVVIRLFLRHSNAKISLGDQQSYYLSTAKNELGVLFARSQGIQCDIESGGLTGIAGELMQPISWREMKCPKTGEIEERKTAKPIDL
jgi:exosome complex component CSL4